MLQDVISLKPNVISAVLYGKWCTLVAVLWWVLYTLYCLSNNIAPSKINSWVTISTITAAITYLIYPFFLNRIVMYFAIWWQVWGSWNLPKRSDYSFKSIEAHAYTNHHNSSFRLNLYINFEYTKVYNYPLVAYPFIELKFCFAFWQC
jgi:hypothetical protein